MRILLDSSPAQGPAGGRGLGRYVRALEAALGHVGEVETFTQTAPLNRLGEFALLPSRHRVLRRPHDLLHVPTAYLSPVRSRRPWVVSVLDLIPLEVAAHRRTGVKARAFHRLAARADGILTLSQYSAGRITELLGVDPARVTVAPLPATTTVLATAHSEPPRVLQDRPYVAAMVDLATPDPRKRAVWLSGVAKRLAGHGIVLAVAGAGTDRPGALPGSVGLGRVDDATWAQVLSGASAFVYTSAYEGQGLPPLEAMAAGVPVVAMDNTSVTEVVGDAGVLVAEEVGDPPSAASRIHRASDLSVRRLSDELLALLGDPAKAQALGIAGRARAAEFDERRFVSGVILASERAMGGGCP